MPKEMLTVNIERQPEKLWGIRIGGGQDRGRVAVLEKVTYHSLAFEAGLRTRDFIVEINGKSVFGLSHSELNNLVKNSGNRLVMRVERGDHIVPSMDEAFPKKKSSDQVDGGNKPYWMKTLEEGQGVRNATGFTTVGKPKMASKQYNSPMEMYSEEAVDEIMRKGTLNGEPFDMSNLMNPSGQEFDESQSAVLSLINAQSRS